MTSSIAAGAQRRASIGRQRAWAAAFAAALLAPAIVLLAGPELGEPGKLFAILLGMVLYAGMVLQLVLVSRLPVLAAALGIDVLVRLHRYMGVVLLALLAGHIVIFLLRRPERWQWFLVVGQEPKAYFGVVAFWGLVLLAVTSIWRARLGLSYERWRQLHLALTAAAMFGGYLHMLTANEYVAFTPLKVVVTVGMLVAVVCVLHVRFGRPWLAAGTPWRVHAVHPERGGATTLELVPDGHQGAAFPPGSVAWLRVGGAPWRLTEHPFSVASGAHRSDHVTFTAAASGDHTSAFARIEPGTKVYVDGPYGSWTLGSSSRGIVLVTAGIGITPAMSVLRTLAGAGRTDVPALLVHGARSLEEMTFREELEQLVGALPGLQVVPVLSRPEPEWDGHVGRVDAWAVRRLVGPAALAGYDVFVCGPHGLAETVERELAALGVPRDRIQVERFEGV